MLFPLSDFIQFGVNIALSWVFSQNKNVLFSRLIIRAFTCKDLSVLSMGSDISYRVSIMDFAAM